MVDPPTAMLPWMGRACAAVANRTTSALRNFDPVDRRHRSPGGELVRGDHGDVRQLGLEHAAQVLADVAAGEDHAALDLRAYGGDDVLRDRGLEREDLLAVAAIDRAAHGVLDHRVDGVDGDLPARGEPRADLT